VGAEIQELQENLNRALLASDGKTLNDAGLGDRWRTLADGCHPIRRPDSTSLERKAAS